MIMEKIRQFFLAVLGFAVFGFVFYLVFRENERFMIIFLISLGGLFLIVLLVGMILRITDKLEEKKRRKPFNHKIEAEEE